DAAPGAPRPPPRAPPALGRAGPPVKPPVAARTVNIQWRDNSALRIRRPVLLGWAAALYPNPAGFVEFSPLPFRIRHRLRLARHDVPDLELMPFVGGGPDRNAQRFTARGVRRGQDEGVALVLMTDLVERADQA